MWSCTLYPPAFARLGCKQPQISAAYNNKGLFLAPVTCSLWFGHMSLFWEPDGPDPPLSGPGRAGVEGRKAEPAMALRASVRKSVASIGQTSPVCHPQGGGPDCPTGRGSKHSGTRAESVPKVKCLGHRPALRKLSINDASHSYRSVKWGQQ